MSRPDYAALQDILEQAPPPCNHEDCQQMADWCAVAPSVMLMACAEHLGHMLQMAGPKNTWFVHAFQPRRHPLPM